MVRDLREYLPPVLGQAVKIHVLECAARREQKPAQPREFGANFVLLAQVLSADGFVLGRGEVGPLVLRGQTSDEACQAISDIPARDGPLPGTAGPEAHLLATRYDLDSGELDGLQNRWIAVLPLRLVPAAKVPARVAQLDIGPGLHASGLGRLVLGDEALGPHISAVLRQLDEPRDGGPVPSPFAVVVLRIEVPAVLLPHAGLPGRIVDSYAVFGPEFLEVFVPDQELLRVPHEVRTHATSPSSPLVFPFSSVPRFRRANACGPRSPG